MPETLATPALFLGFALAVLLAVDGWLGALGMWNGDSNDKRSNTFVYLFLAVVFTAIAVCAWYVLASVEAENTPPPSLIANADFGERLLHDVRK